MLSLSQLTRTSQKQSPKSGRTRLTVRAHKDGKPVGEYVARSSSKNEQEMADWMHANWKEGIEQQHEGCNAGAILDGAAQESSANTLSTPPPHTIALGGAYMKLHTVVLGVLLTLAALATATFAQQPQQWANTQVVLTSTKVGNSAQFYINSHDIGEDICIDFTLDPSSYNVTGDMAGRYTLHAGSGSRDVYVGQYTQQDTARAWYAYVTFKWYRGACN